MATKTEDVVITIVGTSNPIVFTEPITEAGGAVFGSKKEAAIGCFIFWNRPTDAREELQKLADRHSLKVRWENNLPPGRQAGGRQLSLFTP